MDALSDVLRVAHMTGGVFLHAEFTEPWCLAAQVSAESCSPFLGKTAHVVPYHYVVDGRLVIQVGGEASAALGPGEVVMFPHNDPHLMGGDLALPPTPVRDVVRPPADGGLSTIRLGGGGALTRLICGFLGCQVTAENPVIGMLPPVLRLDTADAGASEWIRTTFRYAADEVAAGRAGSETILAKLSELLFVEAVRRHAEALPEGRTGWLAGLADPYVSRALALLHGRIDAAWTVDDLGREVGLSRSALADRFTRLIGVPPIQYLAGWRMQVAAQKLRESHASMAQIAIEVGYDSEAAFTRAFKRHFKVPPATWRRRAAQPDAG